MTARRTRPLSGRAALVLPALAALTVTAGLVAPAAAAGPVAAPAPTLAAELQADLEEYLRARGTAEHVSAAALSVSLPDQLETIDVTAGTAQFGGSVPVRPDALWQIGSNTKAFTSVLLLQLEAEGRLSIDDPLARWRPCGQARARPRAASSGMASSVAVSEPW